MVHRLRSDESFELDSFWWSPDSESSVAQGGGAKSHGTLRYSPRRGFELTVFDLLPGLFPFQEPDRIPVLFGETLQRKPCVLFDAVLSKMEGNLFGGHHRFVLRAHDFLLGEHVAAVAGVKSQRFHLRLRGLREWLVTSMRLSPRQVRKGLTREGNPEGISVQLGGPQLRLGFDWRERGGQVIEEHATATFEFEEEIDLQRFIADWVVPLQDLLMLATREQSVPQSLVVERYDKRRAESVHPAIRHGSRAETWNRYNLQVVRTPHVPLARPRENEFKNVLLPAAALADDLEGPLERWYDLHWRLREAGASFFTSLNQDLPRIDSHFLECMSFAEAYHRGEHGSSTPLSKAEHKRVRALMLECVRDHPHEERYKRALDDANRPNNTERITELFARARKVDFGIDLHEASLPGQLVATRNYLTHWSDRRTKVLDDAARFHALRRLTLVLQVNLLLDLGIEAAIVRACVDESYRNAVWGDDAA
jgi:hypothetical protein